MVVLSFSAAVRCGKGAGAASRVIGTPQLGLSTDGLVCSWALSGVARARTAPRRAALHECGDPSSTALPLMIAPCSSDLWHYRQRAARIFQAAAAVLSAICAAVLPTGPAAATAQ